MKTTTYYMEQMSDEWFMEKLGCLSASTADELLVKGKNEHQLGAGLITTVNKKAKELLRISYDFDGFSTKATQQGIDREPVARREYSKRNMCKVEEVGFVKSDEYRFGYSPDLHVEGGVKGGEIKCFGVDNHLDIVMSGVVPKKIIAQCQFSMMVSGRESWDAIFWNDDVIEPLQYAQFNIKRDEEMIELMRKKAIVCSGLIDEIVSKYITLEK